MGGEGSGGKGAGSDLCPGLFWSFCWLVILFFIAWPLAGFFAGFYILLLPFSACIPPLKDVCDPLLKALQLPLTCAQNMIAMKELC